MATVTTYKGKYHVLRWSEATGRKSKIIGHVGELSAKDIKDTIAAKELELRRGVDILGFGTPRAPTFADWVDQYLLWHRDEFPHSHERVEQIVDQHLMPVFER